MIKMKFGLNGAVMQCTIVGCGTQWSYKSVVRPGVMHFLQLFVSTAVKFSFILHKHSWKLGGFMSKETIYLIGGSVVATPHMVEWLIFQS
jgi:hypothetical protein